MVIRTYHPGDEKGIITLNDTVLKEYGFAFSPRLDRDLLDIPKYYTNRNGQFFLLVEEEGSRIVGSIAVSKISPRVCKMRHFYILKEYRGRGWGTELYDEALAFIKKAGYREIWLSTAAQFTDAIAFYEHKGFKRSLKPLWHYRRADIFYMLKLD
jgi:putative acetyltransferase